MIIEGLFVHHDRIERHQVACTFKRSTRHSIPLIQKVAHKIGTADLIFNDDALIFPAFIDIHVHARDDIGKKESYKEDFNSLSLAAINGGVFAVVDMPNNLTAPPINQINYKQKLKLVHDLNLNSNSNSNSKIAVALYAGITRDSNPFIMDESNVPYKYFFNSSPQIQITEEIISRYKNQQITFHAEDANYFLPGPELSNDKHYKHYKHHEVRSEEAEIRAIKEIIKLTIKYNLKTIIAHVSTVEGVKLCQQAKKEGLNLKLEVCFHHLLLNHEEHPEKYFQVNPPLRSKKTQRAMLDFIIDKNSPLYSPFDYLVTDHAPHTFEEKMKGISGFPGLDTYGLMAAYLIKEKGVDPTLISRLSSYNPGKFFNYFQNSDEKIFLGKIEENYHAKFTVMDFSKKTLIDKNFIQSKCKHSPYNGMEVNAKVFLV
ncbi:MAG: amidohydrolase family protein [Oligoflexia bacterium]|nr:amidohydrolase family protein [Oligoflexia bacterium]